MREIFTVPREIDKAGSQSSYLGVQSFIGPSLVKPHMLLY